MFYILYIVMQSFVLFCYLYSFFWFVDFYAICLFSASFLGCQFFCFHFVKIVWVGLHSEKCFKQWIKWLRTWKKMYKFKCTNLPFTYTTISKFFCFTFFIHWFRGNWIWWMVKDCIFIYKYHQNIMPMPYICALRV